MKQRANFVTKARLVVVSLLSLVACGAPTPILGPHAPDGRVRSSFEVTVDGGCSHTQFYGDRRGQIALILDGRRALLLFRANSYVVLRSTSDEGDERETVQTSTIVLRLRGHAKPTRDGGVRVAFDRGETNCEAEPAWLCEDVAAVRTLTCRWERRPVTQVERSEADEVATTHDEHLLRCVADRPFGLAAAAGELPEVVWLSPSDVEVHNDALGLYPTPLAPRFSRRQRP